MDMKKINSGRLRAIGYDASHRMLQVQLDDGSTLHYSGVGEDTWRRLASSGSAWSFYRDNIEEEFISKRVSGNGHGSVSTPHASPPLLNPDETTSHSTKLANNASQVAGYLPQAGEEANESLRELYIDAPAVQNPLDELFGKP